MSKSKMIKSPVDVVKASDAQTLSEWSVMVECYGRDLVDTVRVGNAGRVMAVRRVLKKHPGMHIWTGRNNAAMWSFIPDPKGGA